MHDVWYVLPSSYAFLAFAEPSVVRSLAITDVTTTSVSLNWTEPEGNAASYTVQWIAKGDILSNMTNETSFTIKDLIPGSQYNITVAAVANSLDEGERASVTTFTSRSIHHV